MIANAISRAANVTAPGGTNNPLNDFYYRPIGGVSSTGVAVTPDVALSVPTVFACIRVLGDSLGVLPGIVGERVGEDDVKPAPDNEWFVPINSKPNLWQTPIEWRSMGVLHLGLRGNFYNQIVPPGVMSDHIQINPLDPDRMKVEQLPSRRLRYTYTQLSGQPLVLSQDEVLHIKLMSDDGIVGMSPITFATNTIGVATSRTDFMGKLFRGGGFIKWFLTTTKHMTEAAFDNFRKSFSVMHGPNKPWSPPILEDDMQLKELGMSNQDLQTIESEEITAIQICQIYGVPPHLVHVLNRMARANLEEQGITFKSIHLAPWVKRFEQAFEFHFNDPQRFFVKYNMDELMRGDQKSRYEAYNLALGGTPFLAKNEPRRLEGFPPVEGGDEIAEPLNMEVPGREGRQGPAGNEGGDNTRAAAVDLSPIIASTAERIVTRELKALGSRADKAGQDKSTFLEWARTWYTGHSEYICRAVEPICLSANVESTQLTWMIDRYCESSIDLLCRHDVQEILSEWTEDKTDVLTKRIKEALSCTNES